MYNDFEIKVPGPTGLKHEIQKDPRDWILGAADTLGALRSRPVLKKDGHGWDQHRPTADFQRLADGDSNICVSDSAGNACEYGTNELRARDSETDAYLRSIGMIDEQGSTKCNNRIIGVGSGTDPSAGNTVTAVAEFIHKNLLAPQSAWPWDNTFTKAQFYAGFSQEIADKGKPFGLRLGIEHEWVPTLAPTFSQRHSVQQQINALMLGTPTVSVDGNYARDEDGLISSQFLGELKDGKLYYYNHRVTLEGYEPEKFWVVHDHYTNQILQFRWDYPFGNAKLFFILKKTMQNLYRKTGQKAIGLYVPDAGGIVLYRDGLINSGQTVQGGSIFKAMGWTYAMAQEVSEWPYPIIGAFGVDPLSAGATLDTLLINV